MPSESKNSPAILSGLSKMFVLITLPASWLNNGLSSVHSKTLNTNASKQIITDSPINCFAS